MQIAFNTWDGIILGTLGMLLASYFVLSRVISFCHGLYCFYDRRKSDDLFSIFNLWKKQQSDLGISNSGLSVARDGYKVYLLIENYCMYRIFKKYLNEYSIKTQTIFNEYIQIKISQFSEFLKSWSDFKKAVNNSLDFFWSNLVKVFSSSTQLLCLGLCLCGALMTFYNHLLSFSLNDNSYIHYVYSGLIAVFFYHVLFKNSDILSEKCFFSKRLSWVLFYTALAFIFVNSIFIYHVSNIDMAESYRWKQRLIDNKLQEWAQINLILIFIMTVVNFFVFDLKNRVDNKIFGLFSLPLASSVFIFTLFPIEMVWKKIFPNMIFILYIGGGAISTEYINYMAEIYKYLSQGLVFNILRLFFLLSLLKTFSCCFMFFADIITTVLKNMVIHIKNWICHAWSQGLIKSITGFYFFLVKILFNFFFSIFNEKE